MDKDEVLTSIAAVVLLFTALIDWDIYSWLILAGVAVILFAWYIRKAGGNPVFQPDNQ